MRKSFTYGFKQCLCRVAENKREAKNNRSKRDERGKRIGTIEDEQTDEDYDNKSQAYQYCVKFRHNRADILSFCESRSRA